MPRSFRAGFAAVLFLFGCAISSVEAAEPPRSGNRVFDRAVELVFKNFHDTTALDQFTEAVRHEIDDPQSPVSATSPGTRVDAAIGAVIASLQASHTGHFRPDTIDYFELADVFRFAIRDDLRRLFPPDGDVRYPGIGMVARQGNGLWFASDVYDGSPAARAGILTGDEIISVDGAPYQEILSFRDKVGKSVEIKLRRRPS